MANRQGQGGTGTAQKGNAPLQAGDQIRKAQEWGGGSKGSKARSPTPTSATRTRAGRVEAPSSR
jgi:hypothetical protein